MHRTTLLEEHARNSHAKSLQCVLGCHEWKGAVSASIISIDVAEFH